MFVGWKIELESMYGRIGKRTTFNNLIMSYYGERLSQVKTEPRNSWLECWDGIKLSITIVLTGVEAHYI